MAIQLAEVYSYFNTRLNIISDTPGVGILPGQRAFATDTLEIIHRDEDNIFYSLPFTKMEEDGETTYLDFRVNDLTCSALNTDEIKSEEMASAIYVSEAGETALDLHFTATSLIGALNELMDYIQSGSVTNYWEINSDQIKPIPALNVNSLYIEEGILDNRMEDYIPISETGDTDVSVEFTHRSLLGCLNELKDQVNALELATVLYWKNPGTLEFIERITANEEDLTVEKAFDILPQTEQDSDKYVFLYLDNFFLYTDKSTQKNLVFCPYHVSPDPPPDDLGFYIGWSDAPFAAIGLYGDTISLSGITIGETIIQMTKSVQFQNGTYYWIADNWKFRNTSGSYFELAYDAVGDGVEFTIGSPVSEIHNTDLVDVLTLKAKAVYIDNITDSFDLFDVLSFTNYPSTLYYDNDPFEYRVVAGQDGLSIYGYAHSYGDVDGNGDRIYYGFNNAWDIRSTDDGSNLTFQKGIATNTSVKLNIGTADDAWSNDHVISEILLWANHVYVQKVVGGTKYDLLEFVQGGLYPSILYSDDDERVHAGATETVMTGSLNFTTYLEAAGTRSKVITSDFWRYALDRTDHKIANLEYYDSSTSSAAKLYLGTSSDISTQANFIDKIYLRARYIYIEDGVKSIDLLTLTSGSGFTKGTRVVMGSSQAISTTSETIVQFNSETYDDDNRFSTSTYKFTAQEAKFHEVNCSLRFTTAAAGTVIIRIYKNTTLMAFASCYVPSAKDCYPCVSDTLKLAVSDTVEIRIYQDTGYTGTIQTGNNLSIHC